MSIAASAPSGARDRLHERAERALPGAGLGGYSLPEHVRFVIYHAHGARLVAAVHTGEDFAETHSILDAACAAVA